MDWKTLLIKSFWAGVYGAVASITITQTFNWDTLKITAATAAVRFVTVFVTTIKDNIEQVPLGSKKGKITATKPKWTSNL